MVALIRSTLEWLKQRKSAPAHAAAEAGEASTGLHTYLAGRYANAVVLTFREIEELLGCSLPDLARLSEAWWTTPTSDVAHARVADAWILAHRTARPNLRALTVAFDRAS